MTAQRGTKLDDIDKVFFVVDRKDLDSQTIQEYEKFQKGAVNGNSTTKQLQEQIESDKEDKKIIVTTIQKLGIFIKNNKNHPIFNKHVVIIFDECHRSQFGELHNSITNSFKKYHIFGFTGTPIYPKNDMKGKITEKEKHIQTTENVFGKKLHSYTIIDAIRDDNVLPFSIDYVNTFKLKNDIKDKDISSIDKEKVLLDPIRIANNVSYILENYNAKTKRYETYFSNSKRMNGFNSILCCDSIKMAMMYYNEFKKQIKEKQKINPNYNMKIATIFSYAPNSEEEQFDTSGLSQSHRDFLDNALNDYNNYFEPKTNFNTSSDKNDGFYEYYLHLTKQIKKKEIDIVIVVNMLLTGFDSPMTNTLWVDKKLEMHNLIQAFSRTNRILNSVKSYGKIVCFRDLRNEVDDALALYGDKDASGIVILRSYDEYMNGFVDNNDKYHKGYVDLINELKDKFELPYNLSGSEKKDKEFIKLFGIILRLMNILESFDDFKMDNEKLLSTRDYQNYRSSYLDLKDKYTTRAKNEKEFINDDIEFETELIEQVSINIDYILNLIEKYHKSNCEDKEIIATINTAINSSVELRSKKDLIEEFYNNLNINIDSIGEEWIGFLKEKKEKDLLEIIKNENLKEKETIEFVENCFKNGSVKITGTSINDIMPPITRFGKTNRNEKKNKVISLLEDFFEKYHNLFIY